MEESEGTDRLSLDSRISQPSLSANSPSIISSNRSPATHLEIYVAELEKELFTCKEQVEREKALRREVEKEVQFLRVQLARLS